MFKGAIDTIRAILKKDTSNTSHPLWREKERVEGEIQLLIKSFDKNEMGYESTVERLSSLIVDGISGSEEIKGHLTSRYEKKREELLRSMGEKKQELTDIKLKLLSLEKSGDTLKIFGDCIVTDRYGRVLLLLRKQDSEFEPNKWGLPGGHVEQNETPEQGAIRELVEETGLSSKEHTLERVMEKEDCIIHYYRVKTDCISMIALDDEEHSNYTFMSIDEIRLRDDSDFIKDSRHTLLSILDPMYSHFQVVEKAHSEGMITEDQYSRAVGEYKSIKV